MKPWAETSIKAAERASLIPATFPDEKVETFGSDVLPGDASNRFGTCDHREIGLMGGIGWEFPAN